jgi:hypothetical protein
LQKIKKKYSRDLKLAISKKKSIFARHTSAKQRFQPRPNSRSTPRTNALFQFSFLTTENPFSGSLLCILLFAPVDSILTATTLPPDWFF